MTSAYHQPIKPDITFVTTPPPPRRVSLAEAAMPRVIADAGWPHFRARSLGRARLTHGLPISHATALSRANVDALMEARCHRHRVPRRRRAIKSASRDRQAETRRRRVAGCARRRWSPGYYRHLPRRTRLSLIRYQHGLALIMPPRLAALILIERYAGAPRAIDGQHIGYAAASFMPKSASTR